jgi:hypothetical protein
LWNASIRLGISLTLISWIIASAFQFFVYGDLTWDWTFIAWKSHYFFQDNLFSFVHQNDWQVLRMNKIQTKPCSKKHWSFTLKEKKKLDLIFSNSLCNFIYIYLYHKVISQHVLSHICGFIKIILKDIWVSQA